MKKVLITGSGGLIGSEAVEYYYNKGYKKDFPNWKQEYNLHRIIESIVRHEQ